MVMPLIENVMGADGGRPGEVVCEHALCAPRRSGGVAGSEGRRASRACADDSASIGTPSAGPLFLVTPPASQLCAMSGHV
eukprot:1595551-Pleurochrysis_carterae.AAC.6